MYEPNTGVFRSRVQRSNAPGGSVAGSSHGNGYRKIAIDRRRYYAHRLAWLYVHGRWPTGQLDHINLVRDDNRILNLREASCGENNQNSRRRSHNTSGFKGASWWSMGQKWKAQINVNGRHFCLGFAPPLPEYAHIPRRGQNTIAGSRRIGTPVSCLGFYPHREGRAES
jgi:hypothetical protein